MKTGKCLITIIHINDDNFNYKNYDCFIGVEAGAVFLLNKEEIENKYYVSDFDSISKEDFEKIEAEENSKMLNPIRDFVDTEEAIKFAHSLGYETTNIDILVNENLGRKDHLFNVFNLARKFKVNIRGEKFRITPITKNTTVTIRKDGYKYLSIFIFQKAIITTEGLKWNLSEKDFNLDRSTNLISNEILEDACTVRASRQALVVQAND